MSNDLRAQLNAWLVASKTGARRLRAGVPAGWRVGDKTGTGMNGAVNNLAIIWPPERAPILLVVMMSESDMPVGTLNKTHAAIAKLVLSEFVAGL